MKGGPRRWGLRPGRVRSFRPEGWLGPAAALALFGVLLGAPGALAQGAGGGQVAGGVASDPEETEGSISPRGAMIRSMVLPGWGHVATESYGRGGFYAAAQGGALWMLWQTVERRSAARSFGRRERRFAEERLVAGGIVDPDSLRVAVAEDPAVQGWEALADTRGGQVEDWVAISLFLLLIGGVDAYVAAHLMDYPDPLALRVRPLGGRQGVELGFVLPIGGRPANDPRRPR